jgi:hypothetical protein
MPDNSALIKQLEEELKNVMPTAPVSTPVHYYPANNTKVPPLSALVCAVEGPGKLALTVFGLHSHPKTVLGVHHVTWRDHREKPSNFSTMNHGSWDYPNKRTPREHLELHTEVLEQRLAAAKASHSVPPKAAAAS